MNVDLNKVECLVKQTEFGYEKITNVCTGAVSTVDWTTLEYIVNGLAGVILASMAIGIAVFGILMWRNF